MAPHLEIRILGPLEVTDGTTLLRVGGARQRALLARLAVAANRVVPVDVLLDDLWGPAVPSGAKQALQAHASRIRKGLGDPTRLVARPPGYVLTLGPDELDAARFESLLGQARAAAANGEIETATRHWADAEALRRGPALAEFTDYAFAQAEAARLEELRLAAIEGRVEAALDLGRHGELVAELEELVATNPYRERLWSHLILALYRCGRQADALGAYQRVRRILAEELGIVPSPDLQRLDAAVLAQKSELEWRPPTAVRLGASAGRRRRELPAPLTSFVGREADQVEIGSQLERSRMVTIIGPGGAGKSRLASELARGEVGRWRDAEVFWVELAPVDDGGLVPTVIASAVGLQESPGMTPLDTVAEEISTHDVLLILDNCEHLVEACASAARALLARCPSLRILATSREPLQCGGETVYRLGPLPVPTSHAPYANIASTPAVRLFTDRAEAACGFVLTADNAIAVAEICSRLDGLPLAIELAAARTRILALEQIASTLDATLGVLGTARRGATMRHSTLRASIDWSYVLLSPAEKILLARLSVFAGGFSLDTVEAVCTDEALDAADVLDVATGLLDRSFLQPMDEVAGVSRFRLLQPIRQYAHDRLSERGEVAVVSRRHAEAFAQVVHDVFGGRRPRGPTTWVVRLEADLDNIRAALRWSINRGDPIQALRLAADLVHFWRQRGSAGEGRAWLDEALAKTPEARASDRAWALYAAAELGFDARNLDWAPATDALALFEQLRDVVGRSRTSALLAFIALYRDERSRAAHYAEEAARLATEACDDAALGYALEVRGYIETWQGHLNDGFLSLDESRAAYLRCGDRASAAVSQLWLAWNYVNRGLLTKAAPAMERAVQEARDSGNTRIIPIGLYMLGATLASVGRGDEARSVSHEAMAMCRRSDMRLWHLAMALLYHGRMWLALGQPERALASGKEMLAVVGPLGSAGSRALALGLTAEAELTVGNVSRARSLAEEALPLMQAAGTAWNIARTELLVAAIELSESNVGDALRQLRASLAMRSQLDDRAGIVDCAEVLADAVVAYGDAGRLERLLTSAARERAEIGYVAAFARSPSLTRRPLFEPALSDTGVDLAALVAEELAAIERKMEPSTDLGRRAQSPNEAG